MYTYPKMFETTVYIRPEQGNVDLRPFREPTGFARTAVLTPGFITSILGCNMCPYFEKPTNQPLVDVRPRAISTISQTTLTLNCDGIKHEDAACHSLHATSIESPPLIEQGHLIRRAIIKLTDTCQMQCIFCVNADGPQKHNVTSSDMTYDIFSRFRPQEIEITGGEPLSQLPLLIDTIQRAKLFTDFIMLNTNMELFTPEKMQQLEKAGLSHLHFAIHTLSPNNHKIMRGNPQARLHQVLTYVDYALRYTNLKLIPEFVPMSPNFHEFPKVYEYVKGLRDAFGERIVELEVGRLIPTGRAINQTAPSLDLLLEVLSSIGKPAFPVEIFCFGRKTSQQLERMGFRTYPCDAGTGMFYFELDGQVLGDNFTGSQVATDFRKFDPARFSGISCPFRV